MIQPVCSSPELERHKAFQDSNVAVGWQAYLKELQKHGSPVKGQKTNKPKLLLCTWVVWQVWKATVALRRFVPMKGLTVQIAAPSGPDPKEGGLDSLANNSRSGCIQLWIDAWREHVDKSVCLLGGLPDTFEINRQEKRLPIVGNILKSYWSHWSHSRDGLRARVCVHLSVCVC